MSSNTARATVAAALVAAAMLAGCSAGRDDSPFIPDTQSMPQSPPVVGAAPAAPAAVPAAPVISGAATGQAATVDARAADRAIRRAEHQRKVARREEREAKAAKHRAAKRAAKREAALRAKLREARRQDALAAAQQVEAEAKPTKPAKTNVISGSSVETKAERDRRADMEARAAVVRYHELLDQRDADACDLLTPRMLHSFYGNDEPGATERCRAGVEGINQPIKVQILRSAASGPNALLDTVTYIGDTAIHQGLAMALVDGTWQIDVVKRLEG
jgi:hypothetical protein